MLLSLFLFFSLDIYIYICLCSLHIIHPSLHMSGVYVLTHLHLTLRGSYNPILKLHFCLSPLSIERQTDPPNKNNDNKKTCALAYDLCTPYMIKHVWCSGCISQLVYNFVEC